MEALALKSNELSRFYREELRPYFERNNEAEQVQHFDQLLAAINSGFERLSPLQLGFLGESQVGKSSLINALLGARALPAGGVGPLTAQALRVRYGKDELFTASYHGKGAVNRLRFALERMAEHQGTLPKLAEKTSATEEAEEEVLANLDTESEGVEKTGERASPRLELLKAQAQRLLCEAEAPDSSLTELIGGLRCVLGMPSRSGTEARPEWALRIQEIQQKLGLKDIVRASDLAGRREFQKELELRAAGWLSPLVEKLELHLDRPLLEHVELVDLPGVGVVGDAAAQVAGEFVRAHAQALVLVLRNNGITESIVSAIESADVLTRRNFDESGLPLFLAVTRLDDVAKTRRDQLVQEAEDDDQLVPPLEEVFANLCPPMVDQVRRQLKSMLQRSRTYQTATGQDRGRWDEVISAISEQAQVHCVVAPDYLRKGGMAPQATGIDALREQLQSLGEEYHQRQQQLLHEQLRALGSDMNASLERIRGSLQDEIHGDDERRRMNDLIDSAMRPLQERLSAFQGETRQFLSGTMEEVLQRLPPCQYVLQPL